MRRSSYLASFVGVLALTLAACGGGEPAQEAPAAEGSEAAEGIVVADVGFATPESVLHDAGNDVYLVSNINGAPLEADGNGFISRLSPEGEVLELKWIDGAAEGVTLNAPKGMTIQGGMLYVADIDCIRMFAASSGEPAGEVCVEGATFLNDVAAADDGSVFFTDTGMDASFSPTGADAVYRLVDGERVTTFLADENLGGPNGVAVGSRGIMVVTFNSGEIFRLDGSGVRTDVMPPSEMQLDGVEMMADGGFLMSSWGQSCVYRVDADGQIGCVVTEVEAPADIGVDRTRNRVLIPLFNANQVRIVPLG